jgi:hypothetical protein
MHMAAEREQPWGRIVAGIVAVAAFSGAVACFVAGSRYQAKLDAAHMAEPIRLAVDLSKPGTFAGKLNHTFSDALDNCLAIVTESTQPSPESAQALAKGLSGRITLYGPQGDLVAKKSFGPELGCFSWNTGSWTPIIDLGHFAEGVYDLKVTVDSGAPRLAGVPQWLVGRYVLCGIEGIPVEIYRFLGIVGCLLSGSIGLAIAIVTVTGCRRPVAD